MYVYTYVATFIFYKIYILYICICIYHIAGNFDVFDTFQQDRQNLTRQIFKAMYVKYLTIHHPLILYCIKVTVYVYYVYTYIERKT